MNRDEVLRFLVAAFGDFLIHEDLIHEIAEVIQKSGFENKFFNLLLTRLKQLRDFGVNAIKLQEFESLAHTSEGLYSMHLSGRGFNVRILYSFFPDGTPVLLLGFPKKSGKKVTDYHSHTPVAVTRFKSLLEAHNHGE